MTEGDVFRWSVLEDNAGGAQLRVHRNENLEWARVYQDDAQLARDVLELERSGWDPADDWYENNELPEWLETCAREEMGDDYDAEIFDEIRDGHHPECVNHPDRDRVDRHHEVLLTVLDRIEREAEDDRNLVVAGGSYWERTVRERKRHDPPERRPGVRGRKILRELRRQGLSDWRDPEEDGDE